MRLAVSGTQCIGKTTFIEDFCKQWPMYSAPKTSYKDLIREKNLNINKLGDEEGQRAILYALIDQVEQETSDHVIFDRSPWDNLVYTMWLNANDRVSDKFVKETIQLVRQSLIYFDICFFLPLCAQSPVRVEAAEQREIDSRYREEIDILFKSLMNAYNQHSNVYYPFSEDKGSPAFIEIFGNREQRIQLCKFYLNDKGDIHGEEESLINEELTQDKLDLAREAFNLQ